MSNFAKNKFLIILVCVTLIVILCSAFYNKSAEKIPFIENTVGVIMKPFQSAITYSVNGIGGFF